MREMRKGMRSERKRSRHGSRYADAPSNPCNICSAPGKKFTPIRGGDSTGSRSVGELASTGDAGFDADLAEAQRAIDDFGKQIEAAGGPLPPIDRPSP